MSLTIDMDMTESDMEHPTAGRRRRYKSPPILHAPAALPVPRLDDHLDTENVPPMRKAKRKQSVREPTTPTSTASRLPYEYEQAMGITQVGSGETEGLMRV